MEAGLAAALGQAPDAPLAVLEVDEKYLPTVLGTTRAWAVALLNLSRDQMDRAAEIWLVARRWRDALASAPNCRVVANADDPLVAWAAGAAPDVVWVAAGQRWHEDSWCCPQCGSHLSRDELGWRCGECEFTRPPARWVLDGSSVIDSAGRVHEVSLSLPGQANRANAVIALAVAEVFGVDPAEALAKKYGFKVTKDWLEHIQKSSVRFNSGGSGSFVSPDGLVQVNLWPSIDGSDAAAADPRRLAALERASLRPEQVTKEHHEVEHYLVSGLDM